MLEHLRVALFGQATSPTADLYLLNALGTEGLRRPAPTVIETDRALVIVRHHLGHRVAPAGRRLIYVLDDDVLAGPGDQSLPPGYRLKLDQVERRAARQYLPRADLVIASTPVLAARLRPLARGEVAVLRPFWAEQLSGATPIAAPLRVGYLGSDTHAGDLRFLAPVLGRILAAVPEAELWMPASLPLPRALARHDRLRRIPAVSWPDWRRQITGLGLHLALYPLLETPFNQTRSVNKLIEHGLSGAAGIYSESWAEVAHIRPGEGLTLPNSAEAWEEAVLHLLRHPPALADLAEGGQHLAARLNDPAPQRAFWPAHLFG